MAWCDDSYYQEVKIGADDEEDGMKNLEVVRRIPDWQKKFPAFAGCAALGEGWYLPAIEELEKIYTNREVLPIFKREKYRSSSERGDSHAWYFNFSGNGRDFNVKFWRVMARAVSAF